MEQTNKVKIKQLLEDNKETLLEFHKSFYNIIDKIKEYEDFTKDLILHADTLIDDTGKLNKKELLKFFMSRLLTSKLSGFDDLFTNF